MQLYGVIAKLSTVYLYRGIISATPAHDLSARARQSLFSSSACANASECGRGPLSIHPGDCYLGGGAGSDAVDGAAKAEIGKPIPSDPRNGHEQPLRERHLTDRSGSSLNVYISGNAIQPALHVPGLEHQNVSAFGCADCLVESWSKRLANLAAVQVNLDGTDRRGIEVNMSRNKKWRSHVIAILRAVRGENWRTDVPLGRAATIKKRLEVDAVLIGLAVNVPGNHCHGVLTGGDRSGCSQNLVRKTEGRAEVSEWGAADIDANVADGSQSLEPERKLQVLRNNF